MSKAKKNPPVQSLSDAAQTDCKPRCTRKSAMLEVSRALSELAEILHAGGRPNLQEAVQRALELMMDANPVRQTRRLQLSNGRCVTSMKFELGDQLTVFQSADDEDPDRTRHTDPSNESDEFPLFCLLSEAIKICARFDSEDSLYNLKRHEAYTLLKGSANQLWLIAEQLGRHDPDLALMNAETLKKSRECERRILMSFDAALSELIGNIEGSSLQHPLQGSGPLVDEIRLLATSAGFDCTPISEEERKSKLGIDMVRICVNFPYGEAGRMWQFVPLPSTMSASGEWKPEHDAKFLKNARDGVLSCLRQWRRAVERRRINTFAHGLEQPEIVLKDGPGANDAPIVDGNQNPGSDQLPPSPGSGVDRTMLRSLPRNERYELLLEERQQATAPKMHAVLEELIVHLQSCATGQEFRNCDLLLSRLKTFALHARFPTPLSIEKEEVGSVWTIGLVTNSPYGEETDNWLIGASPDYLPDFNSDVLGTDGMRKWTSEDRAGIVDLLRQWQRLMTRLSRANSPPADAPERCLVIHADKRVTVEGKTIKVGRLCKMCLVEIVKGKGEWVSGTSMKGVNRPDRALAPFRDQFPWVIDSDRDGYLLKIPGRVEPQPSSSVNSRQ